MTSVTLHDVELRHLMALRAVAEHGTFGKAASSLGYTQSAVSQQIAALERVVGEALFDRQGGPRPARLTPTGRVLVSHAEAILDRVRVAEADLSSLHASESGRLSLGTFQSVSVRVLPQLLAEMRASHPGVEIVLSESDDLDVSLQRLRTGELDITFAARDPGSDEFESVALFDDPLLAVCPLDSPILPDSGPVKVRDLTKVPMIGEHPCSCQTMIEDQLRSRGVEPEFVFRTGDNSAIQAMVRAGVGHAIMPRLAVDASDSGVAIRAFSPPLAPRTVSLTWVAGRSLPPVTDAFVEAARRQADALA